MITNLIWWVVVGLIAGWAAGKIMKGGGYGAVMDIILGIVGAVVGGWLMGMLGIHAGGLIGTIIVAIIGAVIPDLDFQAAQEGLSLDPELSLQRGFPPRLDPAGR